MRTVLHADQALLPTGWARDVVVEVADGRITAVTPNAAPAGNRVAVLLPALVNLHSHAFQRAMAGLTERRGRDPRDSFWTWRHLMYRFLDRLTPEDVEAITAFVQMEMLEAGYAAVAEFHYLHHQPGGAPYASLAEMSERIAAAAAVTSRSETGACPHTDRTQAAIPGVPELIPSPRMLCREPARTRGPADQHRGRQQQ